jgi:hypothetical protein
VTSPSQAAAPLRREVLVLYDSAEGTSLRGQTLPSAVQVVLNHLGLIVHFQDLEKGLPDPALSARARGVVTLVYGDQVPDAPAYADWLTDRIHQGQSVAILGGLGFLLDTRTGRAVPRDRWSPLMASLGLRYEGDYFADPKHLTFDAAAPQVGFERPWREPPPSWVLATAQDPGASVFLRVRRADTGQASDMGVLGPNGAVLLGMDYLLHSNPVTFQAQWRVDPFWLLGRALHVDREPHFDPTTINGRRIFYSHIDGDGFSNMAHRPHRTTSAEVVRDQVLTRTSLPVTVSVIARELVGHPKLEAIARSLYRLPNVEAASHTYTHPFDMEKGHMAEGGAISDSDTDEIKTSKKPLDPELEMAGSIRYIQTLLPRGKRVELMLWPGRTNPTPPYFQVLERLGVPNMNGGDAKLDPTFPSYFNLSPLARRVGPHLQVYNSVTNENNFTHLWTGPFDGQRAVFDTFRFAEKPRRMAPVNLYYHFYAGEHVGSTRVLLDVCRWAEREPLTPIFASTYARLVQDYFHGELIPDGEDSWIARDYGRCATVRFDDEPRDPDLARSNGVLGYHRANHSLYVHLAPGEARLVLAARPDRLPFLREANAPLVQGTWANGRIQATFYGTVPLVATIAGLAPGQRVLVRNRPAIADTAGTIRVTGPRGRSELEVTW